jgi:hypothetical protein
MADARADVVAGTGRMAPLLLEADLVARTVVDFWSAVPNR